MSSWDNGAGGGWGGGGGDTAVAPAWESGNSNVANEYDGGAASFENGATSFDNGNGNENGYGDADGGAGGGDNACYNCGETGHNKADCPNPSTFTGECRYCKKEGHMAKDCPDKPPMRCGNCRKEGHFIADCPMPLVCPRCSAAHMLKDCPEPMKCYHCEGEHMAKDCPTYVATCKNCGETEHLAAECPNARKVDRSHLPDVSGEEAWKLLEQAIIEKDLDEVKEKVQIYAKAQPETTFVEIEKALRSQGYGLYLIPKERANLSITLTNMDLQGNLGKKYTVNYRFSDKPLRQSEREGWPESHDQVLERLADAGDVVPWVGKPKCNNCEKLGHTSKNCPEDKVEAERTVVKCYNCDQEGHRVRDCPTPRVDKFACKNCGKPGHKVADCTEPRSAANVECRICSKMGHFSKDCPDNPNGGPRTCRNCGDEGHMAKECDKPRNVANIQCRNCDEYGHTSKECPKPRDYSRVQCQNCKEMGHTKVRCTKPLVEDDVAVGASTEGFDAVEPVAVSAGGGDSWNASAGWG
ncbi:hypothetical protein VPNG_08158 [Cytospora leucostoma]|uniref:CCHC-type domain-containing protein n=1 Tax=Cytospora leucostoma TaxID=1230097 RepID=A0A423WIK6_9PEZI|nr:hypothetical protein VPNG_08158 [Cytospora leucostoma]